MISDKDIEVFRYIIDNANRVVMLDNAIDLFVLDCGYKHDNIFWCFRDNTIIATSDKLSKQNQVAYLIKYIPIDILQTLRDIHTMGKL